MEPRSRDLCVDRSIPFGDDEAILQHFHEHGFVAPGRSVVFYNVLPFERHINLIRVLFFMRTPVHPFTGEFGL